MELKLICVIFCMCVFCDKSSQEILSDIITLSHGGQIQGQLLQSYKNNNYYAFQEIPYAAPPVGNLRLKEAIKPKPWKELLKTTKNTKICIQLTKNDDRETEDCLYLNVYTPAESVNKRKLFPVYVYIHGGVFYNNDGTFESFGPQLYMDYGIVLVTLNYRLGAFGFISTEDDILPGNLGFKDQNLALKWVKENIKLFGGDPKKVTIGGQSAGSGSIGYHILSRTSKGLFRAAIQESGSPLCSKMFRRNPRYFAFELGNLLNKNLNHDNSSKDLLQVLLESSAEDIKKHSSLAIPVNSRNCVGNEGNTVWNPVEEHIENGFVKGPMHENFKNGMFNQVPVLIGFNSEEELSFDLDLLKSRTKYFDDNPAYMVNGNLNITEENKLVAGKELKKLYTDKTFVEDFAAFVRFISDAKYTTGVCRQAELQSKYSSVFLYQFSYEGNLGNGNRSISPIEGVGHEEDLNYLFINKKNKNIDSISEADLKTRETLLTMWTNFIKYLNPVRENQFNVTWPKVTSPVLVYQNINDSLNVLTNPRYYDKIRSIYDKYADEFQYTY